ncbi:FMN-binding negative transcriptional regulator [Maribacter stanieri]|uniref:Negative transcriptional regulator, PaiB family n=1 Tax=Maribacter stanieri TaxID=440514 RepID=A0A1I6JBY1_9FLAO|nr:FMN-binding negative transcriptional regulator [Maribacter stanieri]SFR76446.1 negative transcriptional regulator, PaiB family [Maribacter stanieri]|tara:strand:+ start:2855 stop:3463 length:609 start_codon:yes stop_codon:yes gene_type:complete
MFIPEHYKNNDINEINDFLKSNSFGILINTINGKPWGTHIPLELGKNSNDADVLVGHIAKANLQSKNLIDGDEVLCIFNGPHSYISSSWYQQEEVPTWNYIAVHVYGTVKIQTSEELLTSLHELVNKYEQQSEHPISLNDMSDKTMRQVSGIIGFEIEINDIQAVNKLSQGRSHDHPKIISELEKQGPSEKAVADEMKKRMP